MTPVGSPSDTFGQMSSLREEEEADIRARAKNKKRRIMIQILYTVYCMQHVCVESSKPRLTCSDRGRPRFLSACRDARRINRTDFADFSSAIIAMRDDAHCACLIERTDARGRDRKKSVQLR